jgi:type I restriction enzyme, S subunit
MKQMKKNWPRKRLGEVLLKKPQYGLTAKASLEKKKYRYIRITDITEEGRLKRDNFRYVNLNETDFNKYKLENGDFLIARSGSVGRIYLHQNSSKDCVFASYLIRFKLNHKVLMPKYLFYYALSPNYKQMIENTLRKTSQPNINAQEFSNFEIPLPPLEIQRQIVARIEKTFTEIDKATELRQKAKEETEQIFTSALQQIFKNAKRKWSGERLGKVIELYYGRGISKEERKSDGKYLVYGANGVLGRSDKYLVEGDAIIVGRKGTAGAINRVSGKFWPSDVTYYTFGNEKIDIDFLFYTFKNIDLSQLAIGIKPGINRNKVYKLTIPLPPIPEQKKIVDYLANLQETITKLRNLQEEQLKDLEELKKTVLENGL